MKVSSFRKILVGMVASVVLAGCATTADLEKVRVEANQAASAANQAANAAQRTADEARAMASASRACCEETKASINNMFKKSMRK